MKSPELIVAEIHNRLVNEWTSKGRISSFSEAEKAIWLLVTLRAELEMDGFESVFDQGLSREEVALTIIYLKKLGLSAIAASLEQAVVILEANAFYDSAGNIRLSTVDLPQQIQNELAALGQNITTGQELWQIDDRLVGSFNIGVD